MARLLAMLVVLSSSACSDAASIVGLDANPRTEPTLPSRIEAGTLECEYCEIAKDRVGGPDPAWDKRCAHQVRFECPDGGTCSRPVECDVSCCPAPQAEQVGLDQPPWGPVLAAAATSDRPATGVIVSHDGAVVSLIRAGIPTAKLPATLRLPAPFDGWAWSSVRREILYAADYGAGGGIAAVAIDAAAGATGRISAIVPAGRSPDASASGRVVVVAPETNRGRDSTFTLVEPDGSEPIAWPLPAGVSQDPHWDPSGTKIVAALSLGPRARFRVLDPATRTVVDSPRDHDELVHPRWHPSGEFLAAWRRASERCELVFLTVDGRRYATTPLVVEVHRCPSFTFAPDGRHVLIENPIENHTRTKLEVVKLGQWSERTVLTDDGGRRALWLDDVSAAALVDAAGFVAPCEHCRDSQLTPRTPIAASALAGSDVATAITSLVGVERPRGTLAFVDLVDGQPQIHALPPSGGSPRALTDVDVGAIGAAFSPDGRALVFVTANNERFGVIDLGDGFVYRPDISNKLRVGPPAFTPDGASLMAAGFQTDLRDPSTKIWTWKFLFGHWGTVAQGGSDQPAALAARPSWAHGGPLVHAAIDGFDRLSRDDGGRGTPPAFGETLPRMIVPAWHPSGSFFAAWVGAAGHYRLAWVSVDASAWFDTGVRYQAIDAAADVPEPGAVAFDPGGSHLAYWRADPEGGGLVLEVAEVADPVATANVIHRSAARGTSEHFADVAWGSEAATKHIAAATLPYPWTKAAPKPIRPEPRWHAELDAIVTVCVRVNPKAAGQRVSLKTTAIGATGTFTVAQVVSESNDPGFVECLEKEVLALRIDPFEKAEFTITHSFEAKDGLAPP